ncbi:type I secretion target repeat protein [Ketogulonicigenium robustum]|uniref:Type I secretion target repeat protein n=1 Tax=Ketogulonicigenium robustum TaxID=92947 RepID=A0A1W6NYP2_9RHOB|nr:Hint domain-containing protein [Ketogulonicigenium robustum]ARO14376.1 type I secretion target repeat protein [Ketogulonicigenium robustum]
MALIDLGLLQSETVYVDTTTNPTNVDLIGLDALTSPNVVYHGNGSIDLTTILGVIALSNSTIIATGGADVTIGAGLLDVSLLSGRTLYVDGDSSITLNAAAVSLAGVLTDLLNSTTISFSGSGDGVFRFNPPAVGLLSNFSLTVDSMGPGDKIVIPYGGDGVYALSEPKNFWGTQYTGYDANSGYLTLTNGTVVFSQVTVRIKMTQSEYNAYAANRDLYLDGANDTFTFPGDDSGEPPYVIPCFAAGTVIETAFGLHAIETLKVGDLVMTLDNGLKPIRWIGSVKIEQAELEANPNLKPIRISAGALGRNTPVMDLTVSPQHRVLVSSKVAERMLGSNEVLVAAKQLLVVDGVDVAETTDGVEYFHFLLDEHEVVFSNGAQTETLYTGPMALMAVGKAAREEILELFPQLADLDYSAPSARPLASGRQARKLAMRHVSNNRPLIS